MGAREQFVIFEDNSKCVCFWCENFKPSKTIWICTFKKKQLLPFYITTDGR